MRRLLLLPLLAALAVPAAGCGGTGVPTAFAGCGISASHGLETIYPTVFDCLGGGYRAGCRATSTHITISGVDTGARYTVRLYRRGGRCAGDVTATAFFLGRQHHMVTGRCRQAFLVGKTLTLFACGKLGDLALGRGHDCRAWAAHRARLACVRVRSAAYCDRRIPLPVDRVPFAC